MAQIHDDAYLSQSYAVIMKGVPGCKKFENFKHFQNEFKLGNRNVSDFGVNPNALINPYLKTHEKTLPSSLSVWSPSSHDLERSVVMANR